VADVKSRTGSGSVHPLSAARMAHWAHLVTDARGNPASVEVRGASVTGRRPLTELAHWFGQTLSVRVELDTP
jgi:hypothetical protein